jgi:hypothetical protein
VAVNHRIWRIVRSLKRRCAMALDSLPRFPDGKPAPPPVATGAEPPASARGTTMLLQALFLVAFWPGIYTLHQQSRDISAAYRKAEEEAKADAALEGKWQSTHGDGTILEMRKSKFTLIRDGESILAGGYTRYWSEHRLHLWPDTESFRGWTFRYQIGPQELVIWVGGEFYRDVRGPTAAPPAEPGPQEIRFRRIGE